jgi:Carboxypeptidase regulatory-like domain
MKRVVNGVGLLCLFATFIYEPLALGQGLGQFTGSVTDPSGAAVPAAKVTVKETETGLSRTTVSSTEGYYTIPSLRPTVYNLTVEAPGFRSYTRNGLTLVADQAATVNVRLQIGGVNDTIQVTGESAQVDTSTATLKQVVDDRRIIELPLNGRNPATLTLLVAGAVSAPNAGTDQGQTKTYPGAMTISTNGSRNNQVNYMLDGGNNVDEYTNVNAPFPFPDALQEFSVQTSNYNAEYGQNGGGTVNIVTKSGTNVLHGDAFGFLRNSVFNARNFFSPAVDPLKRAQYGGVIGGPVYIPGAYNGHDRTFFFFGYQETTIRNLQGGTSAFVPTPANIGGDFSALLSASNPANPLKKVTTVLDPLTGQPFPGNIIPLNRFDAASVNMLKYLPQGGADGTVFYSKPVSQNFNDVVAKVDHAIGASDRLSGRYYRAKFFNQGIYSPSNILTYTDQAAILSQNALLQETHIFRPSLLNDFRLNYARENAARGPAPGIPNVNDFGVKLYQPPAKAIESISVSGFFTYGDNPPARFTRNNFTLADDLRWVSGRHAFSFGFHGELARVDLDNQFLRSGTFQFTSDVTNYAIASYLLGRLRTFRQGGGEFRNNRNKFIGIYAQDAFRVNSRLTLTYGLRYEPAKPWREIRHRYEMFDPSAYYAGIKSQVYDNAPPGLFFPGDSRVPDWGMRAALKNFEPRLGIAYDLTGDGKTSLRAGGGVFYDTRQSGIAGNRFADVTPFSPQLTYTDPPGPFSNPLGGQPNPFPAPFPAPRNADFPLPLLVITYQPSGQFQPVVNYNWNVSLERQVAPNWLARAAYVGAHGSRLPIAVELNPAVYTADSKLTTDQRRIFQGYNTISEASAGGNSHYHSLQLSLEKRFSHGFTVTTNYTYSKSYDNTTFASGSSGGASDGSSYVYPWYYRNADLLDRGPSDFDIRQRIVTSYVWQLPTPAKSSQFVRLLAGGWQFTGLLQAQTGLPMTVVAGKDQSQTGLTRDRAVLAGTPYGSGACGSRAPCVDYVNPNGFALPALGEFGNVGKGSLRAPGLVIWDMGLFKIIPIRERLHIQLRGEFFNVFNRVNYKAPDQTNQTNTVSSAGFGSILAANDPRIGQVALKIVF